MMILNLTLLCTVWALPPRNNPGISDPANPRPAAIPPVPIESYVKQLENRSVLSWNINKWIKEMVENLQQNRPLKPYDQIKEADLTFGNALTHIRKLLKEKYNNPKELSLYDRFLKKEILIEFVLKLEAILSQYVIGKAQTTAEKARLLSNLSQVVLGIQEELCLPPYTGYCTDKIFVVHDSIMKELDNIKEIPVDEKKQMKEKIQKQIEDIHDSYFKIQRNEAIPDIDKVVEAVAEKIDQSTVKFEPNDQEYIKFCQRILKYRRTLLNKYPYTTIYFFDGKLYNVSLVLQKTFIENSNLNFIKTTTNNNRQWLLRLASLIVNFKSELCDPSPKSMYCHPLSNDINKKIHELRSFLLSRGVSLGQQAKKSVGKVLDAKSSIWKKIRK